MKVSEIQSKIDQFVALRNKADAIEKADFQEIIDDLETKRIELITKGLIEVSIPEINFSELDEITNTFKTATSQIQNQTALLKKAISIGKELISKL